MRNIWTTIIAGISIMALLAVAPIARADSVSSGSGDDGDLKLTVGNLTGVFEGGEPEITFFASSMIGRIEYEVEFERVFEFRDSSGDQRFQGSEALTKADLDHASWTNTGFYELTNANGERIGLGIDFTLVTSTLRIEASDGSQVPTGNLVMKLVVKSFETPQTMTIDGRTFDVSGAEIKIDSNVENWPFTATGSMLALQIDLDSEVEQFEVEDADGVVTVDGSHTEDSSVAEHGFDEDPNDVEEEVRFTSGVLTTSSAVGFFRFVDKATVTDGTNTSTVPVTASFKVEMEDGENEMKLYLAYPRFNGRLEHDPSFGVTGGFPTLLFIIGGGALASLVTVVAIRHRRPRLNHDSVNK